LSAEGQRPTTPRASIVVICYEMERALPRTLLSLSPQYQRNCPPGTIEVIVVDNGSRNPPRAEDFAHLGLDLTIVHWPGGDKSPVKALNHGIGLARAPLICAWIDGARMASPGLVSASIAAAGLHPRPVVATPNYHIGHETQIAAARRGYDEAEEDRLLASVNWPETPERLFEIGTAVWGSGEGQRMLESNALFLTRAMWDELEGYDERFTSAGGGASNVDVFLRACAAPGTQLIRIRGEATFHQIHGGTTSNAAEGLLDVALEFSREYYRLRRKPIIAVRDPGWIYSSETGTLV
jgi:hypothetical protein